VLGRALARAEASFGNQGFTAGAPSRVLPGAKPVENTPTQPKSQPESRAGNVPPIAHICPAFPRVQQNQPSHWNHWLRRRTWSSWSCTYR